MISINLHGCELAICGDFLAYDYKIYSFKPFNQLSRFTNVKILNSYYSFKGFCTAFALEKDDEERLFALYQQNLKDNPNEVYAVFEIDKLSQQGIAVLITATKNDEFLLKLIDSIDDENLFRFQDPLEKREHYSERILDRLILKYDNDIVKLSLVDRYELNKAHLIALSKSKYSRIQGSLASIPDLNVEEVFVNLINSINELNYDSNDLNYDSKTIKKALVKNNNIPQYLRENLRVTLIHSNDYYDDVVEKRLNIDDPILDPLCLKYYCKCNGRGKFKGRKMTKFKALKLLKDGRRI